MKKLLLAVLVLTCLTSIAQQAPLKLEGADSTMPKLVNAKLQQASGANLQAKIDELLRGNAGVFWIAYSIPVEPKERTMCCFDSYDGFRNTNGCCMGCRLGSDKGSNFEGQVGNCNYGVPARVAFVFLRAEDHAVSRVRNFSVDCSLDAENQTVYWLNDVAAKQSIDYLTTLVKAEISAGEDRRRGLGSSAIHTIALHDDPSANAVLEQFTQPSAPTWVRRQTALMLGLERGKPGLEILRKAVKADTTDEKFREDALIGFAQSRDQEGLKDLVDFARNDPSSKVRGQAIFWLAQAGGRKEAEQITDAIENDPDTQVKKRAVFALSQMPQSEGVPMLIQLAKTNKNPVVRKQAIFWLGQSHDPRALDFLEQLLLR